jgi:hypothetical protein
MPKKDNMKLWDSVSTTDPAYTKKVNSRGGFTTIDAQWQLMQATEKWGPYGEAWGVKGLTYDYVRDGAGNIVEAALEGTFWYPGGEFPLGACMAYRAGNESKKKLLTDLTTKSLSKLGFSADVFMGKFDDNKYLQELKANPPAPRAPAPRVSSPAPARPTLEPSPSGGGDTSDPHPDWPVPACVSCGGEGGRRKGTSGRQPAFECLAGCEEQGRDGRQHQKAYWRMSEKAIGFMRSLVKKYAESSGIDAEEVYGVIAANLGVPEDYRSYNQDHGSKVIEAMKADEQAQQSRLAFEAPHNEEPKVEEADIPF